MSKRKRKWIRSVYVLFILAFIGWIGFSLLSIHDGQQNLVSAVAPTPEMEVVHKVKGDKLFLVFQLKHFKLSKQREDSKPVYGEGYIQLYVDGKKVAKIYKTAYVHSGLANGTHTIRVELVHHDHESYGIQEEFTIDVHDDRQQRKIGE